MNMFQKIDAARTLLELPEHATMEEIKSNYRILIRKWHPDRCDKGSEACKQMTTRIIAAYRIISDYCKNYKFSFTEDEVSKYLTGEEWWLQRFGNNFLWSDDQQ